jgi:hypothetical protein
MNTKIVFFLHPGSFKGWLMKAFTGCYSYHCGILMEDTQTFYDMFWMRRRRPWAEVLTQLNHQGSVFKIIDSPVDIKEDYLISAILDNNTHYGVADYALFALRWVYHLIGKPTINAKGMICSEMVYYDLLLHSWGGQFKEVPSPCDLIRALSTKKSKLVFGALVSEKVKSEILALTRKEVV